MNVDFNEHARTGRTTRMLEQAADLARRGCYVMVHTYNSSDVERLYSLLSLMADANPVGSDKVYFRNGSVNVMQINESRFDWDRMRSYGGHHSIEHLVEPYAIQFFWEKRIKVLLEAHAKYDLPKSQDVDSGPVVTTLTSEYMVRPPQN